eukprot:1148261_1
MSTSKVAGGVVLGVGALGLYLKRKWNHMDADYTTYTSTLKPEYFRDRIVWITGASTGIGKALVHYIAGLNVETKFVLTARRLQLLKQIKNDITNPHKYNVKAQNVLLLPIDLCTPDKDYLIAQYEKVLSYFNVQSIDILINNAGFSMRSYLVDFAEKDTIDMVTLNLMTPMVLTQLVLRDMILDDQQFGHIVNIASASARLWPATRSVYSSTKAGLLAFSYSLKDELAEYKNISISCIAPGLVQSDVDIAARGKYGIGHNKRDEGIQKGLNTRRCAQIICTAISNKILECWPANQPVLNLIYKAYLFMPSRFDGRDGINAMLKDLD